MKVITIITFCLTLNISYSQNSNCKIDSIFLSEFRAEIINKKTKLDFADIVIFDFGMERTSENRKKAIYNKWKKIKSKFRNTDFTINSNVEARCSIEIKNHKDSFVIEYNDKGKVMEIKRVLPHLPNNAPIYE